MSTSELPQPQSFGARVARGVIWGQAGKLLETGLTLAFTVLVVRQLGPSDYGQYGLISSAIVVTQMLTALGLNEILGSQMPRLLAEGHARAARRLTLASVALRLGLLLTSAIVLVVFRHPLADLFQTPDFANAAGWIALLVVVIGMSELLAALFTALLQTRFVAVSRALGMVLALGLAVGLFAWRGPSVSAALVASVAGWVLVVVLGLHQLFRRLPAWKEGRDTLPALVRPALTIWAGHLINFGLTLYSSVFLLGVLTQDPSQVGLYNAAVLPISRLSTLLVAGMGAVILPTLAEAGARQGEAGLARAWSTYVGLFVALLIPALSFLTIYAEPLVLWVFGEAYQPAVVLMQILAIMNLVSYLLGSTSTVNLFYATGRQKWMVIASALGATLDIGLLVAFIPRWGALGAALADGIAGLLMPTVLFLLLKRVLPIHYPFGLVLKLMGATWGALLIAYVVVPPRISPFNMLLSIALGGLLFIGLCVWLKPLAGQDLPLERLGPRFGWIIQWFGKPSEATS